MKRLIDFCLLLLMVFWGSNAWADKTMTFGATSPTSDCNLTKLSVLSGTSDSIAHGGITLKITAASDDNASWNPAAAGPNHGQTIALKASANITISSSSAEMKITKIVFNFETNNKGYFAESSTTGGTLAPTEATSYVTTQTWSSDQGASSVSLTSNNTKNKAYITSIDITYQTGGLDNHTVQAYPYTWNFRDESLWEKSENQFVSEIWTYSTKEGADEWRNSPTVATGYDVDLLRGLRFTNHVCADRRGKCVSLPRTATITIPSLHEGQKVKISYTGVDILPTTNLKVSQERTGNIEIYKVTQDGNATLTIDDPSYNEVWGVWISQISVLNAAPVLTMTTPANKETGVDPNLRSIKVTSEKALWAYNVDGTKTPTAQTIKATLTSDDEANNMEVTATFTADETGVKELYFTLPQGKQLESATTYTLNIPANVIMETSGTGNKNCSFTFLTKGLNYLGAYDGTTEIKDNPYTVSTLDNNQVAFAFKENIEKTANFKVIVSDGTTVNTYTKDECAISPDYRALFVPVKLKAGKYYSIKITAGSLKLKDATEGSTLKNNQIVLHLISSLKGINLSMTTPYNQDEAPLTTRIILSATTKDGKNTDILNSVEATLKGESADGSQKIHDIGTVTGIANGNKLVFTPKEGQQLRPNYTYTLKLSKKAELKEGALDDDTFVFTTAKVIGNAPIVESTSPAAGSTIPVDDVQPSASKQIKIKFNEDIQLLDGALIFCRPMGGSESYKSIEYYSGRSNSYNSIQHAKGNELSFDYSGQHLFYGMRYEVTIPTYAIVGNGGQPMENNIKFYFETPKSVKASDSRDRKDVYTWDFTNISSTTFDKIRESVNDKNTYWEEKDEGNDHEYGSSKRKSSFAQGQEIKAGASNTILPELKGLLFNLVKNNSDRFQIVCKNKSEAKGDTYLDLKGGTHYVTIQSVPANAMVYIEHNGGDKEMFNLNTLGVKSIKTITNSNNNCVSVYQLGNTTKDLTFCVQNCKLYRIAIVKDNKTIGSAENDYIKYATYSQSYPVDYSLNERLNGTAVTAYSVSTNYQSDATSVNFTELPNNQSDSGEGVILKTSGNLGESHPIFTTDVNTTPQKLTSNALVGTTGDKATEFATAKKEGFQNYILTTRYFHLDKDENQTGEVIDGTQQCFYKWVRGDAKRNFAYLQLKNPSNANAKTVIYLDWFGDTTGIHDMTAPSQVTSGKTYYTLDGRKVTSPTQKGIYIINGKKIIIK
uniref:Ig-like domain-containing protein n=1 Tax=Prevotella sp. TaxID=59823 RepID=UPI0040269988